MITVAYHEGRWQAVGIGGGNSLPENLVNLQQEFAHTTATIKLVKTHPLWLALVEQDGRESLVLLIPTRFYPSLDEKGRKPYPPEEVMPEIAKVLAEQQQDW